MQQVVIDDVLISNPNSDNQILEHTFQGCIDNFSPPSNLKNDAVSLIDEISLATMENTSPAPLPRCIAKLCRAHTLLISLSLYASTFSHLTVSKLFITP